MPDPMVRVTLSLQEDEYKALELYARKHDASMNATIRALLRVALDHCGVKLEPLPEVDRGSR